MVERSRLGRVTKSWGAGRSGDGRYTVEWEVVEWSEEDEKEGSTGKRKIAEVEESEAMEH